MKTQLQHYEDKLSFEMDPSDLFEAINSSENVIVVDARKPFGYEAEHFPRVCGPLDSFVIRFLLCVAGVTILCKAIAKF